MSYPEHGADYVHRPKFIDRMKAEENEKPKPFQPEPAVHGDDATMYGRSVVHDDTSGFSRGGGKC